MKSLLAALQFLTVIPIKIRLENDAFKRSTIWFPIVGLLIGALTALADVILQKLGFSGLLLSILTVAFLAAITGGLHLDGLADTADGFFSARPRERALEIMRDSHIGTMGVLALIFVLSIKVTALSELTTSIRWKALLYAPFAGRCMQIMTMKLLPYARSQTGGLASTFLNQRLGLSAMISIFFILLISPLIFGIKTGLINIIILTITTAICCVWSRKKIGGFTGDTLGATSELVELTSLLTASKL
jgi:adenosylcobinamide-GDP ribazoletransferase